MCGGGSVFIIKHGWACTHVSVVWSDKWVWSGMASGWMALGKGWVWSSRNVRVGVVW